MNEDERLWAVKRLLFDFVKSPSLRHIRDPYSVSKLAENILRSVDRRPGYWQKWDEQRENLLKSALQCWIPLEDMHAFLNTMAGPHLTLTDVRSRQRAFEDEEYFHYPKEELQAGCLELHAREKALGTELPAIVQMLRDYVEEQEERLRKEFEDSYRQRQAEEKAKREHRLMAGADCGWTQPSNSACWYYRANGRTFRLSPTKDKKWELCRVKAVMDDEKGGWIGKYQGRGDATKVIKEMAFQPEPRW